MKSITNALPKISGGGAILPNRVIEVKEFESTTDSDGELNIQFDNGANTSDDNVYAIALIGFGEEQNNLISDSILISNTTETFTFYSSVTSKVINATCQLIANDKINIYIDYLIGDTTYKYIGFLVRLH